MERARLFMLALLLAAVHCTSAQSWQWVKMGGGIGTNINSFGVDEQAVAVDTDSSGNVYVLSKMLQNPSFDLLVPPSFGVTGRFQTAITKYNCLGQVQWARLVGGGVGVFPVSMKLGSDNEPVILANMGHTPNSADSIYLGDSTFKNPVSSLFLIKFDTNGGRKWIRPFRRSGSLYGGVDVDQGNNIYVFGQCDSGQFDLGPVLPQGGFLAKYSPTGTLAWAKHVNTNWNKGYNYSIAVDSLGNSYVTGEFRDTVMFDTLQLISSSQDPYGLNAFLAKYDSLGNRVWLQQLKSSVVVSGRSVSYDQDFVYITGSFGPDIIVSTDTISYIYGGPFLIKYSSAGVYQWMTTHDSATAATSGLGVYASGGKVAVTGIGRVTSSWGGLSYNSMGQADPFLAIFDTSGTIQHYTNLPITGDQGDMGNAVTIDRAGNIFLVGSSEGFCSVNGSTAIKSGGLTDMVLAKFGHPGCMVSGTENGLVSLDKLLIYPNPVEHGLTVELRTFFQAFAFRIFDLHGRWVMEENIHAPKQTVDLSALPAGMYIYRADTPRGTFSGKIVKGR